ncbi:Catalyzes methyl transfer from S-methylmethionine (SMM) to adenosyl-L-homocysteine (AdoMet) [Coemansia aciculifera]|uniref:Catalyzes methyl transfer from S-methylmethionine (SMM) to adenosyl-L-homocysteine (AdoMet) n=1 Tax=Coemansia aciculifera TaxID=417176 RepID=A0ACC1M6A3_9FUNG|nr:Catalyzes methyl transfer from S-methylmethionine (SMM) to adenosyl-L-homocysteine (AdoMet) [Coemansia aciculifera]
MTTGPLGTLLAAARLEGRPVILDGGFGQLIADEYPDLDRSGGMWVSGVAVRAPDTMRDVHRRYLEAGADIITTATYQASAGGYVAAGLAATEADADALLAGTIVLAVEARAQFIQAQADAGTKQQRRPLVAVSLGSVGATLGDCSEYTGKFGRGLTTQDVYEFHLSRFSMLARCLDTAELRGQIDLLAMETIPSAEEATAIVRALDQLGKDGVVLPAAWIAFTTPVTHQTSLGEPIEDAVKAATSSPRMCAIGINCVPTHVVPGLLANIARVSPVPVVCYPNGQTWQGSANAWSGASTQVSPADYAKSAMEWVQNGALVVGGCCKTTPEHIRTLAQTACSGSSCCSAPACPK